MPLDVCLDTLVSEIKPYRQFLMWLFLDTGNIQLLSRSTVDSVLGPFFSADSSLRRAWNTTRRRLGIDPDRTESYQLLAVRKTAPTESETRTYRSCTVMTCVKQNVRTPWCLSGHSSLPLYLYNCGIIKKKARCIGEV